MVDAVDSLNRKLNLSMDDSWSFQWQNRLVKYSTLWDWYKESSLNVNAINI